MTTSHELAELILESKKTGRALQRRQYGYIAWNQSLDGIYDVSYYEYRLAPKSVKHSGWFSAGFLSKHVRDTMFPLPNPVHIEWETEE